MSPHKCQFFRMELIYMELKILIAKDRPVSTLMKDKCIAIRNLQPQRNIGIVRCFVEWWISLLHS